MDGPASSAKFFGPSGVAVDGAVDGNVGVYVADPYNGRIRKVYKSQVTSVAGGASDCCSGDGGPATSAGLGNPYSVALDSAGSLYIADTNGPDTIREIVNGQITAIAGDGTYGFSGNGGPALS